jgi:hypothetical protein
MVLMDSRYSVHTNPILDIVSDGSLRASAERAYIDGFNRHGSSRLEPVLLACVELHTPCPEI